MAKAEKVEQVALLTEKLRDARAAVLTDHRGLTVKQMQELRARLREDAIEYRVVKNTLARLATVEAGRDPAFQDLLTGPVAIAFSEGEDLGASVRTFQDYARVNRLKLDLKGGLIEGRVMGPEQVQQIADLPSREVLIAQLLGTLQSPVAQLVGAIQAPIQELVGLLESYREKLGGETASASA